MASRSTIFIAVRCCQCSTMQVKQKKKSNNKWNCAVCNQKQSARKIFAQGFMAKDIRKFVQSFNMSRKSLEEQSMYLETLGPTSQEEILIEENMLLANQMKKRNDWTEYLDQQNDNKEEQDQNGDDFESKVVTELHKDMFKKPRLERYSTGLETGASDKLLKPIFSKRNPNKHIISQEKLPIRDQESMDNSTSKLENYRSDQRPKIQTVNGRAASKWNDYLTEDDDSQLVGRKRAFKDHDESPPNRSILEAITDEQSVEDDIHPDFI